MRVTREQVEMAITPHGVFQYFSAQVRQAGSELRGKLCPSCGRRSRESVVVNAETGRWIDHAHGCRGDIFDLVAGFAGLNARTDFPRVLALAAEIAGVGPVDDGDQLARIRQQHAEREERARQAQHALRVRQMEEGRTRAGAEWRRLLRGHRSELGERYLRSRGLDAPSLIDADAVRFYPSGDVATALWSLDDCELVNVVRRRVDNREPKVQGLGGCVTAGTLGARVKDIGGALVVLTEGVADTWTALSAWPESTVLGAHGAGNLGKIAEAAAPRVRSSGARVVLVPHRDRAGEQARESAIKHLTAGGVEGSRIVVVQLAHKDLNDAWRAGWRVAR